MLWLCLLPTRLSFEALGAPDRADTAVIARKGPRRWIVDSSTPGVAGVELGTALALHNLTQLDRQPKSEAAALEQLAYFAYSIGTPVHVIHEEPRWAGDPPLGAVVVEVSASLSLFGGLQRLRSHVKARVGEQPLSLRPGIAPTIEGALLAAQAGLVIGSIPRLRTWVARQPLRTLRIPEQAISVCEGSGMSTAGDVLRVAPESLARRFGQKVPSYLRRLTGDAADARESVVPPDTFRRRWEMAGIIETTEGLLFPLRRVFVEFEHYLRARDCGVAYFAIELSHEDHSKTIVDVRLSVPSRDSAHFVLITKQRFERVELKAGVTELAVVAARFEAPPAAQQDLFDGSAKQLADWNALMERFSARWGADAIWTVSTATDHRPERAWLKAAPGARGQELRAPPRPTWLLESPQEIARPRELIGPPERIAVGWWDDSPDRDYFIARDRDGKTIWVYQDKATRRWHLHGLWA